MVSPEDARGLAEILTATADWIDAAARLEHANRLPKLP